MTKKKKKKKGKKLHEPGALSLGARGFSTALLFGSLVSLSKKMAGAKKIQLE